MYGVCKICGCTEKDPCYHPDWGMCWWVDETHELCSHCADLEIKNDPATEHCINSSKGLFFEEDNCIHPEWKCCHGCELFYEDDGICDLEL